MLTKDEMRAFLEMMSKLADNAIERYMEDVYDVFEFSHVLSNDDVRRIEDVLQQETELILKFETNYMITWNWISYHRLHHTCSAIEVHLMPRYEGGLCRIKSLLEQRIKDL